MKIAVIGAKGLPARQGGIEHYSEALYTKLTERGHSVDLYARSSYVKQPWFSVFEYKGVRIICLPSLPLRGLDALTNSCLAAFIASSKDYDNIHFNALGPALFTIIPRLFSSAKIIVTCHGLDWQRDKWGKFSSMIIRLGEKAASIYAHEIVVVSETLKTYFATNYYIEPTYIPNGPGEYAESDSSLKTVKDLGLTPGKYLLFLGRLVPEKRPDFLIRAFQILKNKGWKLVLVGGDSDTAKFAAKLHKLAQKDPNIIFTGELKGSRLAEIVKGAGLFVSASSLEGLPLTMLEAMREGIPVIASDITPHQQLLGKDRGLLFDSVSVLACAKAIEQAMLDPKKLAVMAQKAQEHVKANYSWSKITADYLAVYIQKNALVFDELEQNSLKNEMYTKANNCNDNIVVNNFKE